MTSTDLAILSLKEAVDEIHVLRAKAEQSAIDEQILKQQLLSAEAEVTRLTRWKDSVNREIAALAENYEKQIAENERLVRKLEKSRELAAAFQKERDRCESKWFEAKQDVDALRADLARVSEELGLPPGIGPAPGYLRRMREQLTALREQAR